MAAKLTKAQKEYLAKLLIRAAGNLLHSEEFAEQLSGDITPEQASEQLGLWLHKLPGSSWHVALTDPSDKIQASL